MKPGNYINNAFAFHRAVLELCTLGISLVRWLHTDMATLLAVPATT